MKIIKILYLLAFISTLIVGFFNFEKSYYIDDSYSNPIFSIPGFKSVAYYTAVLLLIILFGIGRISNSFLGRIWLTIFGIIFYLIAAIIANVGTLQKPPGAMVQGGIGLLILIFPFSITIFMGILNSLHNQRLNSQKK